MTRVIVDPEELRRFASHLRQISEVLREKKSALSANHRQLEEVWRDVRYAQFEEVFSDSLDRLEKFLIVAERYVDYLQEKARRASVYLGHGG